MKCSKNNNLVDARFCGLLFTVTYVNTIFATDYLDEVLYVSDIGEPKHIEGHSTEISQIRDREFMCPECGKIFEVKETAENHLHSIHLKHLQSVHGQFHSEDVGTVHV